MSPFALRVRTHILTKLRKGDKTARDMADSLGISYTTLHAHAKALEKLGAIRKRITANRGIGGGVMYIYQFVRMPPQIAASAEETGWLRHPSFSAIEASWGSKAFKPPAGVARLVRLADFDQPVI